MTTGEDIVDTTPPKEESANEPRGSGIDRAMADAEKRLGRLLGKLHHAAQGSAAFEGAERDAKRVLEWLESEARELRSELDKLAEQVGEAASKSEPETLKPQRVDAGQLEEQAEGARKATPAAEQTPASGEPPTES